MGLVVPAVLPSSRDDFREKVDRFAAIPDITSLQIDIVDGRFAAPASWPYTALEQLRQMVHQGEMLPYLDRMSYEIDLMCMDADRAAAAWLALGATRLTFHAESVLRLPEFLASLRKRYGDLSATFGMALDVATDASLVEPYLGEIDYVQFMGIDAIGKQGQPFDRRVIGKLRAFHAKHPHLPLQVDGGVSLLTAGDLVSAGATRLIIGSALMRASDLRAEIEKFEALQTPFGI